MGVIVMEVNIGINKIIKASVKDYEILRVRASGVVRCHQLICGHVPCRECKLLDKISVEVEYDN
jgi:hypothetical protein